MSTKKTVATLALMLMTMVSTTAAYAGETQEDLLPDKIVRDGRVFEYVDGSSRPNSALPDFEGDMSPMADYQVIGSDVGLYIDYSHGHGGDHFAAGWVQATAPHFSARAQVWSKGSVKADGLWRRNQGNIARASSYLATGLVPNAVPMIFYRWDS